MTQNPGSWRMHRRRWQSSTRCNGRGEITGLNQMRRTRGGTPQEEELEGLGSQVTCGAKDLVEIYSNADTQRGSLKDGRGLQRCRTKPTTQTSVFPQP
jgi:hypothetical protein